MCSAVARPMSSVSRHLMALRAGQAFSQFRTSGPLKLGQVARQLALNSQSAGLDPTIQRRFS
ncbi:hypothetical protein MESS4_330134 [Mesorhizobium sp. STM 4661]|nr:hypothetical protein MESS4_330134 [Mesorhizobium sp. STM 4661]